MYTPATSPIPDLELTDPYLKHPAVPVLRHAIPAFMRSLGFHKPRLVHGNRLVDAYRSFQDGSSRLILGFRHAYGDDPQALIYGIHYSLPREARRLGTPLKRMAHAHFVYGAEVPLWSGSLVRWVLPRSGAVPVNHVHLDSRGLNRIRRITVDGAYPLALAPEGHVTHRSDQVAELETGTARFGFWCCEDLARQGRTESVTILPVDIRYHYGPKGDKELSKVLKKMETILDIRTPKATGNTDRLRTLITVLSTQLAELYPQNASKDLITAMLDAAAGILGLEPKTETVMDRTYRIRQAAWDRLVRNDLSALHPFRRLLANRRAGEAWYAMRHLETAQVVLHLDILRLPDSTDTDTLCEYAANLYDFIQRLLGGTLRNRAKPPRKTPVLVIGEPILVDSYLDMWKTDKKAALQEVTGQIRSAFELGGKEFKNV